MTYKRKTITEKLEKPGRRSATFTKRRTGLFSKAADLCVLSDTQIAVMVKSVNDKHGHVYSFGHSSFDNVIDAFLNDSVPTPVNNLVQESGLDLYKQCHILKNDKHDDDDDDRKEDRGSSSEFWLELEKLDLESNSIEELSCILEKLKAVKEDVNDRLSKIKSSGLNNNDNSSNDSIVKLIDQSEKNVCDNVKRSDINSCDDDGNFIVDFAKSSYGDWDASLYSLGLDCAATVDDYSAAASDLGLSGGGQTGGGSGIGDCSEKKYDDEFMQWLELLTNEV